MPSMSMNSVLMKFFNLPPAMRMMLAVAGFGSLASIMFFLTRGFFQTRQGKVWILIILGIGVALAVVIILLIWMFRRKRSKQLSGALESQGPTRGDIAEQERLYREKFRGKLTELRTNGLSVYRLPWFVLLGEPGCGKTASLIHSGLDFPLGKDEVPGFGGTRNYNWWFTNDAVILDTAGRISFQEEGTTDRVEWEYFLKLIKQNRPRCPVNGLVVAIPADKLLRDTSEERAQKATILRERLRQVHQALGVRFPTFVLVTKMDLVGGFSEFFEEIRVDLQQRNQMFGWSRPGEFEDSFDPVEFPGAFDEVYYRLRDWSMRYLQRKATEQELGLIVTFPEGFRDLREPLNDYISTIFQKSPLLEPPFFRGFYFTSAVQEGAPIFDVFSRARPGVTTPERPARVVDSKAFFIHDLYERKVFAEQGLVFRSAQHVSLNRRMRRLVWIGSAAMLVLMLLLFTFGYFGVSDLVTQPRKDCALAAKTIETGRKDGVPYAQLGDNLELARSLQRHYQAYDRPWTGLRARSLYIGANIAEPRDSVRLIHARFVLETILRPVLQETATRLESMEELGRSPERYVAALEIYTRWYGEVVGQAGRQRLTADEARQRGREFDTLLAFLDTAEESREGAVEQTQAALESLATQPRYYAREILRDTIELDAAQATETIKTAVLRLAERWLPLTRLGTDPQDEFLRYWLQLAARLDDLRNRYHDVLKLAGEFKRSETYGDTVARFMELTDGVEFMGQATEPPRMGTLARAYFDLRMFLGQTIVPQTDTKRIKRFMEQRDLIEQQWSAEFGPLRAALEVGAPNVDERPQREVYAAIAEAQAQLRKSYDVSLAEVRKQLRVPEEAEPVEYYASVEKLLKLIEQKEALPTFDKERASIVLVDHPFGDYGELISYLSELRGVLDRGTERGQLDDLRTWPVLLTGGGAVLPPTKALQAWFDGVQNAAGRPSDEAIKQRSGLVERPFWRPVSLYGLADSVWFGHQQRTVGALLEQMRAKCGEVTDAPELPGLARLMPGYDARSDALPFEHYATPTAEADATPPTAEAVPAVVDEKDDGDWRRRRRPRAAQPAEPAEKRTEPVRSGGPLPPLVTYHTRDFLYKSLAAYHAARQTLADQGDRGDPVIAALDRAADAYIDRYFLDWNDVYDDYSVLLDGTTLKFLEQCSAGAYDWPAFHQELHRIGNEMTDEFGRRLEAIVREVVMFADVFETDARGDALFKLVDQRLRELGAARNLQGRLEDVGRTASSLQRRRGDAIVNLSEQFTAAWREYLRQVDQTGADPKNVGGPPDRQELREAYRQMINWRRIEPEQAHFIAPLLDIAAYGEQMLRHYLDRQVAALFAGQQDRYPLVANARDQDASFSRLSGLAQRAMAPEDLIEFLRKVDRFQQDYGRLFAALHAGRDDPYAAVLGHCAAWVEFLYGADASRLNQESPSPLNVKWAIAKHEGTTSAGNFYNRLTITLPLLAKGSYEPVGAIEEEARSGREGSLPPNALSALAAKDYEYRWSLFKRTGHDYAPPAVRVSDKNPHVGGPAQVSAPWRLPGSPWSLLLMVGADPANRLSGNEWIIPVLMSVENEAIGFDIAIQFERPFPGPIAPVADPGPVRGMESARAYLSGGRPVRDE